MQMFFPTSKPLPQNKAQVLCVCHSNYLTSSKAKLMTQLFPQLQSGAYPQGHKWCQQPLRRYKQIWSQLLIKDSVVCRQYTPGPQSDKLTVPIIPKSLRQNVLHQCHDAPNAALVGPDKTIMKVRQLGYWVGMIQDINLYCRECLTCQSSKPPAPQKAPLISIPIGKPWEMVAVDVLQVLTSSQNHRYILVIQDYFTKWAEAIPMANQTATTIARELVKVFSNYGLPVILHPDQGRNFESSLQQTLDAFGILNHEHQPTTLKGTEWWRDLTAPFYKCCMHMFVMSQIGKNFCHR